MLILASKSPRRAELLKAAGIDFTIRAADTDETPLEGEAAEDYVLRVAEQKALAADASADELVLAADTTVLAGSEILGKPADMDNARRMLTLLSGRRHDVITGICLRKGNRLVRDAASTAVWFSPLTDADIESYAASGEPMDKAGAYGIQGIASRFIDRIEGSYTNVVGLPVALVWQRLRDFD